MKYVILNENSIYFRAGGPHGVDAADATDTPVSLSAVESANPRSIPNCRFDDHTERLQSNKRERQADKAGF
jgi:hypothetical protein